MRLLKAVGSPPGRRNVQRHLEQFVEQAEPKLMRWLYATWNAQAEAVSYQELCDAILARQFDESWLARWQLDYARFVVDRLAPAWIAAITDAGKRFEDSMRTRSRPASAVL